LPAAAEVGGDDDADAFVKFAQQKEALEAIVHTHRAIWIALLRTIPSSQILTRIASKKTSG